MEKDGHEYGNYDKYTKNSVEEMNDPGVADDGQDRFFGNYNNMLRQMNGEDADAVRAKDDESIKDTIGNFDVTEGSLMEKFNLARASVDTELVDKEWEAEKQMMQEWDDNDIDFLGRLSPFAKELIYKHYIKGATVKDLSLKFGVLP